MLIGFSFENVSSFKNLHHLSMEASSLKKDDFLHENVININDSQKFLKSTLIYGANASGKTNLIKVIRWFSHIVLDSYKNIEHNVLENVMPFILDEENIKKPSEFEIVFIEENTKYRYGLSIFNNKIQEEWLYLTQKRENCLFHRKNQNLEYRNKSSFKEAELFFNKKNEIEKTASYVPFVSVLSAFQGKHSQNVTNFFKKIQSISGANDEIFGNYTFNLINEDKLFQQWADEILKDFNIYGLIVNKEDITPTIELPINDGGEKIQLGFGINTFKVRVKKYMNHSKEQVEFPLELESAGTRKIIHLLGPIYDTLKKGNILFIDEFDSKFHTLLSKHIFKIFHKNCKNSQLIANVQDTNLMDTEIFRRDQIWFVHKDSVEQDSQLYSLAEYKNQIQKSYSEDYLQGAFDAIPLFSSIDEINQLME